MSDPYSDNVVSHKDGDSPRGRIRIGLPNHVRILFPMTDKCVDPHVGLEYSMDSIEDFLVTLDRDSASRESIRRGPFSVLVNNEHVDGSVGSPRESDFFSFGIPQESQMSSIGCTGEDDIPSATRSPSDSEMTPIMPELNVAATEEVLNLPEAASKIDPGITTFTTSHSYTSLTTDACHIGSGPEDSNYLEEAAMSPVHQISMGISGNGVIDMLMHHYAVNVASLLQPIRHPQNPYRDLYIPAALQVATDLSSNSWVAKGNIHSSLFHSLLASSAFHLSSSTTDNARYHQLGIQHKQHAISLLQTSMQMPGSTLDHQALLMTMLSLVTIDVSCCGRA